ncbi:hypothetical protein Pmar_PMAR019354 [Perkinsus marinus ATCC 50983]|uniref:Uncharacterized protein n=1 Tax=Perkinsus marinus (strain ATCC 50983 / TXsc) TaxID=423536 RepID=C5KVV8_PERM5|nr:hypothetical protein Pmar_PMAR019354 [Perkinsus marinus ATCC 50983]EER11385.1 hypothetical protein Pmar_PMAR019354 [Perkinsus marinus ATCC 50983]|eukprot:XP_002779590.1 hypothetical protein Pmar_PMAR019354 [Perkinsus marinus ATCC 50983]
MVYGIRRARQAAMAWAEKGELTLAAAKKELWIPGGDLTREIVKFKMPEMCSKVKAKVKWLGLTMSSTPSGTICFRAHAEEALERGTKGLRAYAPLCRRQYGLSEEVLKALWHRVIIPKICYGAELWGQLATYAWFVKKVGEDSHDGGEVGLADATVHAWSPYRTGYDMGQD